MTRSHICPTQTKDKRQKQNSLALRAHTHAYKHTETGNSVDGNPASICPYRAMPESTTVSLVCLPINRVNAAFPQLARTCLNTAETTTLNFTLRRKKTTWCKDKTADVTWWRHVDMSVTWDWPVMFLQNTSVSEMKSEQTRLSTFCYNNLENYHAWPSHSTALQRLQVKLKL